MQRAIRCAWLVLPLLAAATLSAQSWTSIGDSGATARLEKHWVRRKLNEGLGGDQFECTQKAGLFGQKSECFLMVMEVPRLLENEVDLRRVCNELSTIGHDQPLQVQTEAKWLRSTRYVENTMEKLRLLYRYEVVARDGLAYFIMAWAAAKDRELLDRRVGEFLNALTLPPADSAWGKGIKPQDVAVTIGGTQLWLPMRESAMRKVEGGSDELLRFASGEEEQLLTVHEFQARSAEAALDQAIDQFRERHPDLRQVTRRTVTIDGAVGGSRTVAFGDLTVEAVAVPAAAEQWFLLRWYSPGEAGQRPERDRVFAGLRRTVLQGQLTLPALPATAAPEPTAATRFLAGGRPMHRFTVPVDVVAGVPGKGFVGWSRSWNRCQAVLAAGGREEVLATDLGQLVAVVHHAGAFWVVAGDRLGRLENGAQVETGSSIAVFAAAVGNDLLVLRELPPDGTELMTSLAFQPPHQELVRRRPDGSETRVTELGGFQADGFAVDAAGTRVLLVGRPHDRLDDISRALRLRILDLASQRAVDLPDWTRVEHVVAVGADWLVTGKRRGQPAAIHRLRSDGSVDLLVTGHGPCGVDIVDDELLVLEAGQLTAVSLADCAKQGQLCEPFTGQLVDAIGARLIADLPAPGTAAQVRAAREQADRIAGELAGTGLPKDYTDFARLLESLATDNAPVRAAGRTLLAVVLVAIALERGAVWVECPGVDWQRWQESDRVLSDTLFALLNNPSHVVLANLMATEAAVSVRQLAEAEGRAVVFGLDAERLAAHGAGLLPPGIVTALDRADVAALRTSLVALPKNALLRRFVYTELARRGHGKAVEVLARSLAEGDTRLPVDEVGWFRAWQLRATTPAEAARLVLAATPRLADAPHEPEFYLCLGQALTLAHPDRVLDARRCFERVLELRSYGWIAEQARAALKAR